MHIDAQGGGHRLDVQPEGGEQLQEAHLLAGHRVGERGAGVVALRPAASLQESQAALLGHSGQALTLLGLGAGGGVVGGAQLLRRFLGHDRSRLLLLHLGVGLQLLLLLLLAASLALLLSLLRGQGLAASLLPRVAAITGLWAIVLPVPILLRRVGIPVLLLPAALLLASLALLLAQPLPLLTLLLTQVIVLPGRSRLGHVVLLLALLTLTVPLVSLVIGMMRRHDCRCLRGSLQLVVPLATRGVLPAAQGRGQGDVIDLDVDPIPFR